MPCSSDAVRLTEYDEIHKSSNKSPDIAGVIEADSNSPVRLTQEEFKQLLARETGRWRQLAKETGFKLEEQGTP